MSHGFQCVFAKSESLRFFVADNNFIILSKCLLWAHICFPELELSLCDFNRIILFLMRFCFGSEGIIEYIMGSNWFNLVIFVFYRAL